MKGLAEEGGVNKQDVRDPRRDCTKSVDLNTMSKLQSKTNASTKEAQEIREKNSLHK